MTRSAGRTGRALVVVCLTSWALAALVASPVRQGQDQRPPVFRGTANLVYVDVYPKRDGRFVDGLRAGDFQVFEDGKPQRVDTFELIRFAANTPDELRRDPNSQAEGDQLAADPRNRLFVIYLDLYHTSISGSRATERPLVDFLNQVIGPSDVFGVLTPERFVGSLVFGRRSDTLEAELSKNWHWGEAEGWGGLMRTPAEQRLQTCLPASPDPRKRQEWGDKLVRIYREDLLLTSLENLVQRVGALKDERKNVLFISEGWVPRGPQPEMLSEIKQRLPTISVGPDGRLGTSDRTAGQDLAFCDREAARLAMIDFPRRFYGLLTAASLANVTFYPIDVGRLRIGDADAMGTLRSMASATNGFPVVNTNDLSEGFRRIAEDLQAYYLLGYYSTNSILDGRYRKIEVKVTQPGVSLTARRGYTAPTEAMRRAAEAAAAAKAAPVTPSPVIDALAGLARLRSDAEFYSHGARSAAGLEIIAEIAAREMATGRWPNGADVQVTVPRSGGGQAMTASGRIEAGARSARVPVSLDASDVGPWRVRVQVTAGGRVLDQDIEVRAPVGALLGDAVYLRGGSAASAPLRPTAELQFRRTERLRVEWSAPAAPAALDERSARVLDRRGQPLAVGAVVAEYEAGGQRRVAVDVGLAPLADGDYLVELVAGRGADTDRRLIAFRVVR